MTPEELRRTIEFIVESQARLAAAQEQDREERIEFQRWAKEMNLRVVGLIQVQTQALAVQSRRLDQYEAQQRTSELAAQRWHEELLLRVDRVIDILTTRLN
jgi:hypothetical protein